MQKDENWALHILVDAKTEYTKKILDLLTPRLYEGIQSLYSEACKLCHKNNNNEQLFITFQKILTVIPKQ